MNCATLVLAPTDNTCTLPIILESVDDKLRIDDVLSVHVENDEAPIVLHCGDPAAEVRRCRAKFLDFLFKRLVIVAHDQQLFAKNLVLIGQGRGAGTNGGDVLTAKAGLDLLEIILSAIALSFGPIKCFGSVGELRLKTVGFLRLLGKASLRRGEIGRGGGQIVSRLRQGRLGCGQLSLSASEVAFELLLVGCEAGDLRRHVLLLAREFEDEV